MERDTKSKREKSRLMKGVQWIADYRLWTVLLMISAFSCAQNKKQAVREQYTCPMHPEILRDKPGTCPICFMDLVKVGEAGVNGSLQLNESQIKLANISTAPVVKKEMEIKTILNGKLT